MLRCGRKSVPFCRAAERALVGPSDFWRYTQMADGQTSREPTTRRLRLYAREVAVAIALTLATLAGLLLVSGGDTDFSQLEEPPGLKSRPSQR